MKKLFFVLTFVLAGVFAPTHSNALIKENLKVVDLELIENTDFKIQTSLSLFDICTVTVSIYQNGELVSSATWTDHDGDCDAAYAGAKMMARSLMNK